MEIKICYIDDNLDPFLVSYLDKSVCNCPDYKYEEYEAKLFYDKRLLPKIKDCRESIEATKNIFDRISNKGYMNSSMLLEQIRDTIDGDNNYTELSKEDIDNLINNFTKLREELNV